MAEGALSSLFAFFTFFGDIRFLLAFAEGPARRPGQIVILSTLSGNPATFTSASSWKSD